MSSMHSLFPLMLPVDTNKGVYYDGYIQVKDKEFRLRVEHPKEGGLKDLRLYGDWQLQYHLQGYEDLVRRRLQSVPDVTTFLVELQNILQSTINSDETAGVLAGGENMSVFPRVMKDIDKIGWHRVAYIDSTFCKFHFSCVDSAKRDHRLQVNISSKYPQEVPDCSVDLPQSFIPQWSNKSSFEDLLSQFEEFVNRFSDLWALLEEFDEKTIVIEPEKPRKSDVYRRVALGNNASIQMTLDPSHPRMCPECRFLGADHVVTPLKKKLNTRIASWNKSATVLSNMERVLEITFPEPTSQAKQDLGGECGICYTYRLETGIPEAVCDNSQCSKPYHRNCLYEWLQSLPSGSHKFGFNKASGECPYCGVQITIQKPDAAT